jgi:hypothetical protein
VCYNDGVVRDVGHQDAAEPAKASSARPVRRRPYSKVPPWIEERALRESRLINQSLDLGIEPPARPGTKKFARLLDPALEEFRERQARQRAESERTLPF